MKLSLNNNYKRIKLRIRNKISGTDVKPRLSVFRSNKFLYGQLINDLNGTTIITTISKFDNLSKSKASFEAGKSLAEKALEKGIKEVVFDRNGYRYHGRVKNFADGARDGGLNF